MFKVINWACNLWRFYTVDRLYFWLFCVCDKHVEQCFYWSHCWIVKYVYNLTEMYIYLSDIYTLRCKWSSIFVFSQCRQMYGIRIQALCKTQLCQWQTKPSLLLWHLVYFSGCVLSKQIYFILTSINQLVSQLYRACVIYLCKRCMRDVCCV